MLVLFDNGTARTLARYLIDHHAVTEARARGWEELENGALGGLGTSRTSGWYDCAMKVISGTVIGGRVEVPSDALAEGDRVAILAATSAEPIQLTPEQENELVAAVEDVQRGNYVDGQDLLAELRRRTGR